MTEKTYNGWTNYETWNVALWLGNEQGSERYWTSEAEERFREATDDDTESRADEATGELARQLQDEIEESAPELGASMFSDLLNAALSEVNWYEIAEHYVNHNKENVLAEEKAEADELDESREAT